ncbi:MAG: DUF3306 domain-containing protein [Gammaproteobacteria bacterium]|nr:DUF3306 domain-containing protein [Gammaproteobacteria bacterium]
MSDIGDSSKNAPQGGFLSRWSKRKQDSGSFDPISSEPVEIELVSEPILPNSEWSDSSAKQPLVIDSPMESEAAAVLTDEDMPEISSLNEDSDYSGFMSSGVSEELRKLALRKLFAGVGFNVRDGLDDYDDDFRNFAALGDIITSDMKHQQELAEEREKEEARKEEESRLADEQGFSEKEDNEPEESTTNLEDKPDAEIDKDVEFEIAKDEESEKN